MNVSVSVLQLAVPELPFAQEKMGLREECHIGGAQKTSEIRCIVPSRHSYTPKDTWGMGNVTFHIAESRVDPIIYSMHLRVG